MLLLLGIATLCQSAQTLALDAAALGLSKLLNPKCMTTFALTMNGNERGRKFKVRLR